ncbi:hypothetical protein LCGC14_1927080 [marine sediment metagenome]|uniref:Uracil-DNA glycosylase-like domain-containing protein n=1 Tax=marine sediment metagenome TaxID=412755 RepID=A0A0F9I2X0_9ZZZZ
MKSASRKDKLVLLRKYLDLETNELKADNNPGNILYEKIIRKKQLDKRIHNCHKCTNLNIKSFTQSVPGWGNLNADIFFIGESPCVHSMAAQFPFAWRSGRILDIILKLSNLTRYDVYLSNSVHCHLETKRAPTEKESIKCSAFLYKEIQLVEPALIVSLGNSAKAAIEHINKHRKYKTLENKIIRATHPARFLYNNTGLRDYILKLSLELDKYT